MKIEMGESLGYSYLRHVKNCWLVQTNWKASEHWEKQLSDDELQDAFRSMRQTFDLGGSVFKGTKDCAQFLRQAEIDVVGVGQDGSIHAIDVAFHEAGLNYGGGVGNRVLKKLLRTVLILMAYHPPEVKQHIYFVSPKVRPGAQQPLENMFNRLRDEYPVIEWYLFTNETFATEILTPTLEKGKSVADTSELFLRSVKLLELGSLKGLLDAGNWDQIGEPEPGIHRVPEARVIETNHSIAVAPQQRGRNRLRGRLQILVDSLMLILLEDFPGLLTDQDQLNLLDRDYCQRTLGLELSGFALLRRLEDGKSFSGRDRYWAEPYGGRYYVCSQWWQDHHLHNAKSLQTFISAIIRGNEGHPGVPALQRHWHQLNDFIASNQ